MGIRLAVAVLGFAVATGPALALDLTSDSVKPGAKFSVAQVFNAGGCKGGNVSPALSWSGPPNGTKSFAVTMFDPDAPAGGFWHWTMFNIPADVHSLGEGADAPAGAIEGRNDFGALGYAGPCPPKGAKPHRYQITVFAEDTDNVGADAKDSAGFVGSKLRMHALAKAELVGVWGQ